MSLSSSVSHKKTKMQALFFIYGGIILIGVSLLLFVLIFREVLKEEVIYHYRQATTSKNNPLPVITPVNEEFGIVVPQINANAPVIDNVDPYIPAEYQYYLTKGVAHAKGTALPYENGRMFLFAHSAGNFYEANRYNAIFYLLSKLEKKDVIYIFYKGKKQTYYVVETKIVNEDEVHYLSSSQGQELVLMTCWPAGTSLKRLLVFARP